jgi:hypothetical protein
MRWPWMHQRRWRAGGLEGCGHNRAGDLLVNALQLANGSWERTEEEEAGMVLSTVRLIFV